MCSTFISRRTLQYWECEGNPFLDGNEVKDLKVTRDHVLYGELKSTYIYVMVRKNEIKSKQKTNKQANKQTNKPTNKTNNEIT